MTTKPAYTAPPSDNDESPAWDAGGAYTTYWVVYSAQYDGIPPYGSMHLGDYPDKEGRALFVACIRLYHQDQTFDDVARLLQSVAGAVEPEPLWAMNSATQGINVAYAAHIWSHDGALKGMEILYGVA